MKKEDLTALGLNDEQIAGVQKLNGIDIAAEQKKTTKAELERDNFKDQLTTAQDSLKGFEGVNVDELKNTITKLNSDLAAKEKEYQDKINDMEFETRLDGTISGYGARNAKAVKALLDIESLKASKNQDVDIKAAIETCQKENDYLFGSTEPINNPTGPTGDPAPGNTKKLEDMSYEEYKAYRQGK